jgi:hypothetical protein
VDRRFEVECGRQVEDRMRRAAERMNACRVPIFVTGGNDDFLSVEPVIESAPYITTRRAASSGCRPRRHDLDGL